MGPGRVFALLRATGKRRTGTATVRGSRKDRKRSCAGCSARLIAVSISILTG